MAQHSLVHSQLSWVTAHQKEAPGHPCTHPATHPHPRQGALCFSLQLGWEEWEGTLLADFLIFPGITPRGPPGSEGAWPGLPVHTLH